MGLRELWQLDQVTREFDTSPLHCLRSHPRRCAAATSRGGSRDRPRVRSRCARPPMTSLRRRTIRCGAGSRAIGPGGRRGPVGHGISCRTTRFPPAGPPESCPSAEDRPHRGGGECHHDHAHHDREEVFVVREELLHDGVCGFGAGRSESTSTDNGIADTHNPAPIDAHRAPTGEEASAPWPSPSCVRLCPVVLPVRIGRGTPPPNHWVS